MVFEIDKSNLVEPRVKTTPENVQEANEGKGGTILECNQTYSSKPTKSLKSEDFSISGMRLQSDGRLSIQDAKRILDIKVDIWRKSSKGDW